MQTTLATLLQQEIEAPDLACCHCIQERFDGSCPFEPASVSYQARKRALVYISREASQLSKRRNAKRSDSFRLFGFPALFEPFGTFRVFLHFYILSVFVCFSIFRVFLRSSNVCPRLVALFGLSTFRGFLCFSIFSCFPKESLT